jgi:4a-hydroxytetrahydrobiopterin dehydratase
MPAMTNDEVMARLKGLDGWERDDDEIEKEFKFADFKASMAFVNQVADFANATDHHPDIKIKYDRVKLTLSTHSEGGITEKDFALAVQIESLNHSWASTAPAFGSCAGRARAMSPSRCRTRTPWLPSTPLRS